MAEEQEAASCHTVDETEDIQPEQAKTEDTESAGGPPKSARRPWPVLLLIIGILTLVLVFSSVLSYSLISSTTGAPQLPDGATVYYNSACGDCMMYIQDELTPALNSNGISNVILKDWTNHVNYRDELFRLHQDNHVDTSLMSHLTTFVKRNDLVIFEGHVPGDLVSQVLILNYTNIPRLVVSVWDDGMMGGPPPQYAMWAYSGQPQTYMISEPPASYISWLRDNNPDPYVSPGDNSLLPLVVVSGFVDGLNPCAFAVLLFFIALLFATRSPATETAKMGTVYIYSIFVVYFLIGLGLLGAIVLSPDPHFMAKVGAILMIVVGSLTMANYFLPKIPMPFHMPKATWETTKKWMKKATLPGATVAGLLVGLCTFPCSGTIYVFVLSLLASKTNFLTGLGYLYIYNLFFILPLVLVLAGIMLAQRATKRPTARNMAKWERAHTNQIRLLSGILMILMGIGFLWWAAVAG